MRVLTAVRGAAVALVVVVGKGESTTGTAEGLVARVVSTAAAVVSTAAVVTAIAEGVCNPTRTSVSLLPLVTAGPSVVERAEIFIDFIATRTAAFPIDLFS